MLFIGCLLFTISIYSHANEQSKWLEFDEVIGNIESHQDNDLLTAIKLAKFYEKRIAQFTLEEQIVFKKLQATLYWINMEYKLVYKSANEGLELTKSLAHPNIIMAELLNLRGNARSSLTLALQDYIAALEISKSLRKPEVTIQSLINLGSAYYSNKEHERALIIVNEALELAQNLNNDKYLGLVYFELGLLYSDFNLPNKTLYYFDKAYYYFTKIDDTHLIFLTLPNIAITQAENKNYSLAIAMYHDSIIKAKETGNYFVISNIYSKLADAYINKPQSEPYLAYQFIIEAEKYLSLVQEDSSGILLMVNKSNILHKLRRYDEAIITLNQTKELLVKQAPYIRTYAYRKILQIESEVLYQQGLYKEAFNVSNQYLAEMNSFNTDIYMRPIEETRIQYESKQHEVEANNLEKKRSKQLLALQNANEAHREKTYYMFLGGGLILALGWLYFIKFKNQRKLLESRNVDHLTDLPNRQSILSRGVTEFNKITNSSYSVLIIKIDNFTTINQIKGYDIGNSILIEISLIITQIIGVKGLCGKYSSNEFIVLLPNENLKKIKVFANEIHSLVYSKSWAKYGLKVVSVSIGMSHSHNNSADTFEALVKSAVTSNHNAVMISDR